MNLLRWILTAALLAGPPIYLANNPQAFTPLLDTLFSVFLFFLAFWIGRGREIEEARQQANDRWLPQAESVAYRLMTLFTNVRTFSRNMRTSCTKSQCDLPELKGEEMKAVRVKMKMECEAASQRLDDIANQLEDSIGDWQRFIAANCRGEECGRIFNAMTERRTRLMSEEATGTAAISTNQDQQPVSAP